MRAFQIFGHRGAIPPSGTPYQNSLSAFQDAVTYSDGFETDVCRSADGVLFLIHEAKYYRTDIGVEYCVEEHLDEESKALLGDKRLDQMQSEDIKKLRLHSGEPIPTLQDLIALISGTNKVALLELKGYDVLEPLARDLNAAFESGRLTKEQVVIVSFNLPELKRARETFPDLKIGCTFVKEDQKTALLYPWADDPDQAKYEPMTLAKVEHAIAEVKPQYIVFPHQCLNNEVMQTISKKHPHIEFMLWVFTETLADGEPFDEKGFLSDVAKGHKDYNLAGIMIDLPEKTNTYKKEL